MSQHQNDPGDLVAAIPEATTAALRAVLEPDEQVTHAVAVVGCSLVLTDRHLMIVREGAGHRPRSGVQQWRLDRALAIHTTPVIHGTGRIVIVHRAKTASVFVSAGEWAAAETLLMEAHRLIHRSDGSNPS